MGTRAAVGDFIDKRESRLGFGEDEFGGDLAFLNVADEGSDLVRMFGVAGKGKVNIRGSKNIEGDHRAGRQVGIFFSFKFDGQRSVVENVVLSLGQIPAQLGS